MGKTHSIFVAGDARTALGERRGKREGSGLWGHLGLPLRPSEQAPTWTSVALNPFTFYLKRVVYFTLGSDPFPPQPVWLGWAYPPHDSRVVHGLGGPGHRTHAPGTELPMLCLSI